MRPAQAIAMGIAVLLIAAAGYLFWKQMKPAEPPPPPPMPQASAPAPQASAEPAIRHPIGKIQPPADKPLPALDDSDPAVKQSLMDLLGARSIEAAMQPDGIIRRIVVTIDNLPREKLSQRLLPVKPPQGSFKVTGKEDDFAAAADNAARYSTYMRLLDSLDAKKLAAVYAGLYPLFQRAYEELGYPGKYFNDRLVEVIDHLIAAPEPAAPVKLVRPKVFYEFADPALERLSAGQKIMVRIGPENATKVKARLREIRREVADLPRS